MPAIFVAFAAVVASVLVVGAGLSTLTTALLLTTIGYASGQLLKRNTPGFQLDLEARAQGVRTSTAPRRVIYGRAQLAPSLFYVQDSGGGGTVHCLYAICEHGLESIDGLVINGGHFLTSVECYRLTSGEVVSVSNSPDIDNIGDLRETVVGYGTPALRVMASISAGGDLAAKLDEAGITPPTGWTTWAATGMLGQGVSWLYVGYNAEPNEQGQKPFNNVPQLQVQVNRGPVGLAEVPDLPEEVTNTTPIGTFSAEYTSGTYNINPTNAYIGFGLQNQHLPAYGSLASGDPTITLNGVNYTINEVALTGQDNLTISVFPNDEIEIGTALFESYNFIFSGNGQTFTLAGNLWRTSGNSGNYRAGWQTNISEADAATLRQIMAVGSNFIFSILPSEGTQEEISPDDILYQATFQSGNDTGYHQVSGYGSLVSGTTDIVINGATFSVNRVSAFPSGGISFSIYPDDEREIGADFWDDYIFIYSNDDDEVHVDGDLFFTTGNVPGSDGSPERWQIESTALGVLGLRIRAMMPTGQNFTLQIVRREGVPETTNQEAGNNAALCCYDYLSKYTTFGDPVFGKDRIDADSTVTAISECRDNAYTANGVITLQDSSDSVFRAFQQAMGGGHIIDIAGTAHIRTNVVREPQALFTEDDVAAGWTYSPALERGERHSVATIRYQSYDADLREYKVSTVSLINEDARAEYGDRSVDIETLLVSNRSQALQVAQIEIVRNWNARQVRLPLVRLSAMDVDPGDVVELALPELNIGTEDEPERFIVVRRSITGEGAMEMTLFEDTSDLETATSVVDESVDNFPPDAA